MYRVERYDENTKRWISVATSIRGTDFDGQKQAAIDAATIIAERDKGVAFCVRKEALTTMEKAGFGTVVWAARFK